MTRTSLARPWPVTVSTGVALLVAVSAAAQVAAVGPLSLQAAIMLLDFSEGRQPSQR